MIDDPPLRSPPWRIAIVAACVLFAVYVLTLAPGVTFWDAGEFIAAAHSLGIPHPPGTPLFVLLLNTWARVVGFLPYAVRTNLFSAVCTAAAAGLAAAFVTRATKDAWSGVAAAITAGAMSSVWSNATETEVYAASLLLSLVTIVVADRAGRMRSPRWRLLTAYLLGLAAPLHVSALVAAPVAIYLSSATPSAEPRPDAFTIDVPWGLAITGVALLSIGIGVASLPFLLAGGVALVGGGVAAGAMRQRPWAPPLRRGAALLAVVAIAASALLVMLVRARHDPAINQGNPSSFSRLIDVVGRRQYAVQPMWPRQAPLWLQIANWFDYADWQVALSLGPGVVPTPWRTMGTVLFAALAIVGATAHRRRDRRTFNAVALLLFCGSLGVVVYLNLKAGPSFGWGVLPDGAAREARERDYFFVLGFWAWGLWAGIGAVALARRLMTPAVGVAVAAVPIVLNWSAVDRRSEPEAGMPRMLARALLEPLPRRAVLFVAGDNDTYPLWYLQQVEHERRDVTIVTEPLLGAEWYAEEFARRQHLLPSGFYVDDWTLEAKIADGARRLGRPVAVALTVAEPNRNWLGRTWRVIGLDAVDTSGLMTVTTGQRDSSTVTTTIDLASTRRWAQEIGRWSRGRRAREAVDPVHEYFGRVLECPGWIADSTPSERRIVSLDSLCNLR